MVISIDSGNKNIKTDHFIFPSALNISRVDVGIGEDVLNYKGLCYSATGPRISYMRDKTENDNFYILALIGIAKEIEYAVKNGIEQEKEQYSITLLNGLPPKHMAQKDKFKNYFLKDETVTFTFNKKEYTVKIENVAIYPQAYAAAVTQRKKFKDYPEVLIVDIGGYTIDYMLLNNGVYNPAMCKTLQDGIITFYDTVVEECMAAFDVELSEDEIDEVIKGTNQELIRRLNRIDCNIVTYIYEMTERYVENIIYTLKQRGLDLRKVPTIFVGGGSVLLKQYIKRNPLVDRAIFVNDISANAKGYRILDRILRKVS